MKYSYQQRRKLYFSRCQICGNSDYAVLDCHRIVPELGYKNPLNTVVLCCLCHRRVHDGQIEIKRKYESSKGRVIHCIVSGVEEFIFEVPEWLAGSNEVEKK